MCGAVRKEKQTIEYVDNFKYRTSGKICSVALTREGVLEFDLENREGIKHAEVLAPFVERAMEEVKGKNGNLMQLRSV